MISDLSSANKLSISYIFGGKSVFLMNTTRSVYEIELRAKICILLHCVGECEAINLNGVRVFFGNI